MPNTVENSLPPTSPKQLALWWLIPLTAATMYLASDYYTPSGWGFPARCCALAIVIAIVVYTLIHLFRAQFPTTTANIVSRYFLFCSALAVFVMATRVVFPVPSAAGSVASSINSFLNELLIWPFLVLIVIGFVLLPNNRRSFPLYCALILMFALSLSMSNSGRSLLRCFVP